MLYFAYGSNLSLEQMKTRCPSSRLIGPGCLEGHRLDFTRYSVKWRGGTADVVEDLKEEVWGLIYGISTDDLHKLDGHEGYPDTYTRFQALIKTGKGHISGVWVYKVVQKKPFIPPTKEYLGIIKEAAVKFNFPEKYRRYLYSIRTAEG